MLNLVRYIFSTKKFFLFHPKKKVDVIVFGRTNSKLDLGKKIKLFELYNQIYISIIFKSLFIFLIKFKKHTFNEIYFKEVIGLLSPKIAIGDEINNNIFKFKKLYPKKTAIGFQTINRSNISTRKTNKGSCDYFLLFNSYSKKYYKNIKAKFLVIGSLKNNEKPLKDIRKKFDLMFVSEFRPKIYEKVHARTKKQLKIVQSIKKNFYGFNEIILNILNEIINDYDLKICIALASNRVEKKRKNFKKEEEEFFSKNLENPYFPDSSSYDLAEKSNLIISMWSNLGIELFAQNKKVFFFTPNFYKNVNWNFLPKKNGFNWQQDLKRQEIKNKIIKLLKLKKNKWNKFCKHSSFGISFDKKNKLLKKLIKKKLRDINE